MRFIWWILLGFACPGLLFAQDLKLYVQEISLTPFERVNYGWDLGQDTPVSSLTPDGFQTIGELIAADVWDFSGIPRQSVDNASTMTPVNAQETCNFDQCGYNLAGVIMSREDRNFDDPADWTITNAVQEVEDRSPSDITVWLRAGAQKEGKEGLLGEGESRFCYISDGVEQRSPSPLWRFSHQDSGGWYLQPGDSWITGPIDCEQSIFNQVCGQGGFMDEIWAAACEDHAGTQSGEILKEGVAVLPSGHRVRTLLVRTVADFCIWVIDGCLPLFKVDEVRTVVYLWVTPNFGTVIRLMSVQNAPDLTSWTTVNETDMKFGLYPPLSIEVTEVAATTVELSWDPGRYTHRIDGYKVYWSTQSGAGSPYGFDSDSHPAQVVFDGPSAVISGLDPETTYYFTVTAHSTFTNPSTQDAVRYESLLYPTQAPGDQGTDYPVEVQATTLDPTACTPTEEVRNLRVERVDEELTLCWDPVSDPCLTHYRLWEAGSADSDTGFATLQDTGLETCWTGSANGPFFLVTAEGPGGGGPWGHYGR
jgi:hypothetical protein